MEKYSQFSPHSFDGRPFSYAEVKLIEDMDSFAVKELIFKMFELHNIQSSQDVKILAKHNVSRLIGLYQALVWKVCMLFLHEFFGKGVKGFIIIKLIFQLAM